MSGLLRRGAGALRRRRASEPAGLAALHPPALSGRTVLDLSVDGALAGAARAAGAASVDVGGSGVLAPGAAGERTWDVVLAGDLLDRVEDPVRVIRAVAALTGECAAFAATAVALPGTDHQALWRCQPSAGGGPARWAPNAAALDGALRALGFARAELVARYGLGAGGDGTTTYRLVVHGVKGA